MSEHTKIYLKLNTQALKSLYVHLTALGHAIFAIHAVGCNAYATRCHGLNYKFIINQQNASLCRLSMIVCVSVWMCCLKWVIHTWSDYQQYNNITCSHTATNIAAFLLCKLSSVLIPLSFHNIFVRTNCISAVF